MINVILDNIAIEPIEVERKRNGIIIPDTVDIATMLGKVISVNSHRKGKKAKPPAVKEGDIVIFARNAVQRVKVDEKDLLIVKEADIFCKLKT